MALSLKYATHTQALSALREAYKLSTGQETLRLATKLKTYIDAGDFTDSDIQSAFGLSVAQLAQFKARVAANANSHASIKSAVGE